MTTFGRVAVFNLDDQPAGDDILIHQCDQEWIGGPRHQGIMPTMSADGMGTVLDEDGKTVLPLKNGRQIDVRLGLATYRTLCRFFEKDPELFNALRALAEGRDDLVSRYQRVALRRALLLRSDLTIRDAVRDVLLSSYQEPDGPVLTNPFKLDSPEQARRLEQMEQAGLDKLLRRLWSDEDQLFPD